jgi:large subunit ribosomal protein L22e
MVLAKKQAHAASFVIDCSAPVSDQIFDLAAYEKYLRDHIKVNGQTNQLADAGVVISRDAANPSKLVVLPNQVVTKRSLKYLTKKFLKKHQLRDWLRVIATDKESYQIKYFNVDNQGDSDEE